MFKQGLGQVAVWIDKCQATAGTRIGDRELQQQARLAHAALTQKSDVPPPIVGEDAAPPLLTAKCRQAKDCQVVVAPKLAKLRAQYRSRLKRTEAAGPA